MILIGELAVWVALLMAIWTAIVSFAGGAARREELVESGHRGLRVILAFVVLIALGLLAALLTHDFSIRHVASFTSANLPLAHAIPALWAGPAGSLLVWMLALAGCSAIAVHTNQERDRTLLPYATGILALVMAFFLAALALGANPFDRLEWMPLDGRGMDPQLQSMGMALHPPALYLGYAAAIIPFAFAVAALITRRPAADWLGAARTWVLAAWFFTTVGILTGMRWAYVEPDWNGLWAWDAVANASVLPWLVNSALVHSIAQQDRRAAPGRWNVALAVAAFLLSVLALFASHGGIISTVHAFSPSSVRPWFTGFLIVAAAGAAIVIGIRPGEPEGTTLAVRPVALKRRRYGGYVAYAGAILLLAAFAGLAFRSDYAVTLRTGDAVELRDPYGRPWRIVSEGVSRYDVLNRHVTAIALAAYQGDRRAGLLTSEEREHVDSRGAHTFAPSTEAGIISSPLQDVYVALTGVEGQDTASLRISFNPLVWWVWFGGIMLSFGGLVAMWPSRKPDDVRADTA